MVEFSGGLAGFKDLRPATKDEPVRDVLVEALDIAARTNPALRTTEALESLLRNCSAMNQTEVYGCLKALLANQELGTPSKDLVLMEFMRYLVRVNQTQCWPEMSQVACAVR
eukprot:1969718-Alexandrium_andersonii.AAC.1